MLDGIVELLDGANDDQSGGLELPINFLGILAGFGRVSGVIIVEFDMKTAEIA